MLYSIKSNNLIQQYPNYIQFQSHMGSSLCFPAISNIQLQTQLLSPQFEIYKEKPYTYITNLMKLNQYWIYSSQEQINSFFQELTNKYNAIPYHNITHGFDVMTALDKYLVQFKMLAKFEFGQQKRIYMLIAAYAHDNGHKGFTNDFYNKSNDPLAIRYSYESPLQNMHSSNLLECFRNNKIAIVDDKRKLMVKMILATDNIHHKELVLKLEGIGTVCRRIRSSQTFQGQDRDTMIQVLIHTADLNSCSKDLDLYIKWNNRLYQEFENQSILQKQKGLALTFQIDNQNRQKIKAKSNVSFIQKMVLPLFKGLSDIQQKFKYMVKNAQKIKQNCLKIQAGK